MRIRKHLTYANIMATIAVFGVVAGGSAYAISKIDTRDIAPGAVTAKKLHGKAVKTSKLRAGAVTNETLADGAVESRNLGQFAPVPMAGVVVYPSVGGPKIFSWFNRLSDEKPTIEHTQTGVYDLHLPGLEGAEAPFGYRELLSSVNLIGDAQVAGEVTSRWSDCSGGGCLHPVVYTFDSAGTPADHGFVYLVYRAEHVEQ
jgi:hypothetical protein